MKGQRKGEENLLVLVGERGGITFEGPVGGDRVY